MNTNHLQAALKEVSSRVQRRGTFKGATLELCAANAQALSMFESDTSTLRQNRATRRTNRYMRRNGVKLAGLDWESLLAWLMENWAQILKLLMSLLIFI